MNLKSVCQIAIGLIAVALSSLTAYPQQPTEVKGTVVDAADGEPVIGATVMVKGAKQGTATDLDGQFILRMPTNGSIVVSSVGYKSATVALNGRTEVEIALESSTTVLDEMVVIGYGVQRKSDVTGSISSVSGKDLATVPVGNALQALQGRAAGVNIIQNSGSPGGTTTIKVRGTGTVNDADPLYVVDGFIVDNIDYLNPSDIANVEIFKDASSSAVYGARAANGVVVITTRTGQEGKTTITFDSYVGVSNPWREIDVMGTEDYALMLDYINGSSIYSADGRIYQTKDADGNYSFDDHKKFLVDTIRSNSPSSWWDAISRTGVKQQYNLSASGGNVNTKYMVSGSYFNEKGIIKGSDYSRFNVRVNLQQKICSWLDMTAAMSYSNEDRSIIPEGSDGVLKRTILQSPMTMTYNSRGYWTESHPLAMLDQTTQTMKRHRLDMNISLSAKFLRYFTYQFKASYYYAPQTTDRFNDVWQLEEDFGMTDLSTIYKYKSDIDKWEINNLLTFNYNNDTYGNLTALVGQTAEGYKSSYQESNKRGTPSNDPSQQFLSSGFTGDKTYGLDREWTAIGLIGRVNYNFRDRYLFQANVRVDGSSKFASGNRWGYFPSVSLGWKFSQESFMRNLSWLSLGKLRVGYGVLGNNRISELSRYTYLTSGYNYPYGMGSHVLQPGTIATTIGNDGIKWEKTKTFNAGLDLSLLDNKIGFSVEYFDKRTSDMLLAVPVVPSAGLNTEPMTNAGAVRNYGVEGQVSYRQRFGDFSMDVGFNVSWVKNKVTSLGTGNEPIWGGYVGESSISDYVTKTAVGRPIGSFYGYVTDGIFSTYEEVRASAQYEPGKLDHEQTTRPGDFRFKDLNGDGQITAEDRTYLGSPLPDVTFGIPLSFTYRDFGLSFFFQGQTGNKIFNVGDYYLCNAAAGNVYADLRSRHWSGQIAENRVFFPLNLEADIPDLDNGDAARNFRASDFFVQDGSYLRLKEVRFTYSLPKQLTTRMGLSALEFFATAYNLWTLTGYEGFDPEVGKLSGTEDNNLNMGVDFGTYPQARSFTFGFKLTI